MSAPPLRRTDHLMKDDEARATLARGFSGRLATVGSDGYPYCVPLLYVVMDGAIFLHNTAARGHLRLNVEHEPRVCFQIDEPGEVFPYGRFECDTTVAFQSVIVFGEAQRLLPPPRSDHGLCHRYRAPDRQGDPTPRALPSNGRPVTAPNRPG